MKTKTLIAAAAVLALAMPAFAAIGAGVNLNTGMNAGPVSVTTHAEAQTTTGSSTGGRMANLQNKGNKEITTRIDSLNKLSARVGEMKNVSATDKQSIQAAIQAEIGALTSLQASINSGSTTTLKADVQSVTKTYRVYALIMPQLSLIAAADRIMTIDAMLQQVGTKLTSRLAQASTTMTASMQASLSDFNAKVADASVQAQAAVSSVTALKPDNGDKTAMQANLTALKAARQKLQTAHEDLVAARKDAQSLYQSFGVSGHGDMKMNASSSASSSMSH